MMQITKLILIVKKLKSLQSKNEELPEDCKVKAFFSWTKENDEINIQQSKILTLLGRKIRYEY